MKSYLDNGEANPVNFAFGPVDVALPATGIHLHGWIFSTFEGLVLKRPRIDAKMRAEHFMMDPVETILKGTLC
jgi:hypothetical protein